MTDQKDGKDKAGGLDAAKKKLLEARGRPFNVDQIIAGNRAKQERASIARKKAQQKLEEERAAARKRADAMRIEEMEKTTEALEEKKERFEEAKHVVAQKQKKPKMAPKKDKDDTSTEE